MAVAEERSFTRAARRLGVSTSALSHAIRGLEERIGVRLLARTTRSVAPTEAGEQLIARLRPALGDIRGALDHVSGLRDQPAGPVRLVVSPLAATMVLAPKLGQFARDYPDVVLDVITTNEGRFDLVAGRFDAGIHLGEFIERDMIAVRVSPDQRAAIVGAPRYFASQPRPDSPDDLTRHRCLNFRHGSAGVYRWEFDRGKQSLAVAVQGPLIVDDVELMIQAAIDGVGLAFMPRVLSLAPRDSRTLPEPAPAAGRALGSHRHPSSAASRIERHREWHRAGRFGGPPLKDGQAASRQPRLRPSD
ncbi:MAG TPA: LysR family transcriptional regulator [Candidatus Saccharimonadales bacterium]|nr:LysR family transcriptional regulator [Candidatus Saccharimonadales bacterium]